MLKSRIRRQAVEATRAINRLAQIEAAISALGDEDLLDLADIFAADPQMPLREMAGIEMAKRHLKL